MTTNEEATLRTLQGLTPIARTRCIFGLHSWSQYDDGGTSQELGVLYGPLRRVQ